MYYTREKIEQELSILYEKIKKEKNIANYIQNKVRCYMKHYSTLTIDIPRESDFFAIVKDSFDDSLLELFKDLIVRKKAPKFVIKEYMRFLGNFISYFKQDN